MKDITVIYEDNHVIAVVKPAGMPSQPDESGDESMLYAIKKYLKEKYQKPGNVFLGLLHRLDRPVSGIMLFAKTSKGAARLSEQFRNRTIEKTYHALAAGKFTTSKGVLTNLLGKDAKLRKGAEYADGKKATLYYEVVQTGKNCSLLRIRIDTGAFHQIRTQLSLAGHPIVGDVKYLPAGRQVAGIKWQDAQSIALCATGISFMPATQAERVNLAIDFPADWKRYVE